ncbi:MAG: hypothetical protein ABI769_10585 [Pseudomonadota bacterium]
MSRRTLYLVALVIASSAVFAGVYFANVSGEPVAPSPVAASPAPIAPPRAATMPDVEAAPAPPAPVAPVITPDAVARWIADSAGSDATKRATAIAALGDAPRVDALPVLRRILTDGEPQVDRALALRSLSKLAQTQGDTDGAIRDAVRHAIYHGDDQTNTADVQKTLDSIEQAEQR